MNWFNCLFVLSASLFSLSFTGAQEARTGKKDPIRINNPINNTLVEIDLPDTLLHSNKTLLVFYALPNGNSIVWTRGKLLQPGDDWHFDIQHIAAQTRYLRQLMKGHNLIIAYMANHLKSWPAWKRQQNDGPAEIRRIVDSVTGMFATYHPEVMLNSHSGGGSFVFGYIDAVKQIPPHIRRIAFIDSNYGYEDSLHAGKLVQWLSLRDRYLTVLAYNDSVVVYNGKPLVSPTGGTWYRSKRMQQQLATAYPFAQQVDSNFITYSALRNRVRIQLKINLEGKVYHTEQVAKNGFIYTVIAGTDYERKAGYPYWGERIYTPFIY